MSPHKSIKVAIADDHAGFVEGIDTVLKFLPDIDLIIKADNGAHLLHLIENNLPDVILLDLNMPVMDGVSTLRELKKLYPAVKVVILTMNLDSSVMYDVIKMGANAYLLKSAELHIITNTIRECSKHDRFVRLVA